MGFFDFFPPVAAAKGIAKAAKGIFGGGGDDPAFSETDDFKRLSAMLQGDNGADLIAQLNRNLGTQQAQGINQVNDFASAQGLPASARASLIGGVQGRTAQAAQEGTVGIERLLKGLDARGAQFLLSLLSQNRQFDLSRDDQQKRDLMQLFQSIGQSAGFAAGGGAGGGG